MRQNRRRRRVWRQSNKERIADKLRPYWRDGGQSFGPASPTVHIDPTLSIPATDHKPIIQPGWTEIPVDQAFWRVWNMNSLQMKLDGYKLLKIAGKWRAFLVKPPKWRKMK